MVKLFLNTYKCIDTKCRSSESQIYICVAIIDFIRVGDKQCWLNVSKSSLVHQFKINVNFNQHLSCSSLNSLFRSKKNLNSLLFYLKDLLTMAKLKFLNYHDINCLFKICAVNCGWRISPSTLAMVVLSWPSFSPHVRDGTSLDLFPGLSWIKFQVCHELGTCYDFCACYGLWRVLALSPKTPSL